MILDLPSPLYIDRVTSLVPYLKSVTDGRTTGRRRDGRADLLLQPAGRSAWLKAGRSRIAIEFTNWSNSSLWVAAATSLLCQGFQS